MFRNVRCGFSFFMQPFSILFLSAAFAGKCENWKNDAVAANPLENGSWSCEKPGKKRFVCKASCNAGSIAGFKKWKMDVSCADGSTTIKSRAANGLTPSLTCSAADQCDGLSAANGNLILKRTGAMRKSFQLKCNGAKKNASKSRVNCNRATGDVSAPR